MPGHKLRITIQHSTPDHPTFTIQLDPRTAKCPEKTFSNVVEFRAMLILCGLSENAIDHICKELEYKSQLNELGWHISQDGVDALSVPNVT